MSIGGKIYNTDGSEVVGGCLLQEWQEMGRQDCMSDVAIADVSSFESQDDK